MILDENGTMVSGTRIGIHAPKLGSRPRRPGSRVRGLVAAFAILPLAVPLRADNPAQWFRDGQEAVETAKRLEPIRTRAKNIILFIGDGMGVTTVTAARILEGQMRGGPGEENLLSFERLPHTAIIKTYNTNQQTPDSAGTMTAMVTGVKTKAGVLSVDQTVIPGDHKTVASSSLPTIFELAEYAGLSTGIVTTTRITHATPAACYAHTSHRDWEADSLLPAEAKSARFPDIARQLIEFPAGDGLEVALGGGRAMFLPKSATDPEESGKPGFRDDNRDLTAEWLKKPNSAYVWNQEQFAKVDAGATDHLLGLFDRSHMEYECDRKADEAGEPSLTEMTLKALEILARNPKGYLLMVEGGRIDHGHHAANPYRALTDTIEFARAVEAAVTKVKKEETLVIVTADHSHVFTMAGYPTRGNPILGKVIGNDDAGRSKGPSLDALKLPYATLGYANGPGYVGESDEQPEGLKHYPHLGQGFKAATKGRPDLGSVDTAAHEHLAECTMPLSSETHGGEDVALYGDGPMAHLFFGVREQNYIFHVMVEALGLKAEGPSVAGQNVGKGAEGAR